MNNMEKGIIIIGAGSPYYGRLAANLAVSIKRQEFTMPVLVYTTKGSMPELLKNGLKKIGVILETLPEESYIVNGKPNYFRAKTFAYDLSPFKETLVLDADMLWLPIIKPSQIFGQLKGCGFTMSNEGKIDVRTGVDDTTKWYTAWLPYSEIQKKYGSRLGDHFYQMRSEFFYFEKSSRIKKLFSAAKRIYDSPGVSYTKIGGVMPDEIAFSIASSLMGIYPHKSRWTPAYWWFRQHMMKLGQTNKFAIQTTFALLSFGGNVQNGEIRKFYHERAEVYYKKMGIAGFQKLADKADVLPERKKI